MLNYRKIDSWTEEDWRNQHACLDLVPDGWHQFNRCQAWYQHLNGWLWVKSYSTLVAAIHGSEIHRRGYYTRTTSKQITQIYNAYTRGRL